MLEKEKNIGKIQIIETLKLFSVERADFPIIKAFKCLRNIKPCPEDHHQHLPVQPGRGGPGHPPVCHADRAVPHVAPVPLDTRRGQPDHKQQ